MSKDSNPHAELLSYRANCHCGTVRLTVRIPSLTDHEVTSCNCSICTRNGYLMVYPDRKDVEFHTGFDQLQEYRFGDKIGAHKFCPTCGSSVLCDFEGRDLGINVRMFQDIEVKDLKLKYVDGNSMEPRYEPPSIPLPSTFTTSPWIVPYSANCHCGLVTYTVRTPPLPHLVVNMCNCSICTRSGYLLVYPKREYVTFHQGHDQLRSYSFGNRNMSHKFCPRCGCSLFIQPKIMPFFNVLAINVAMFQDVDPRELTFNHVDGKREMGPEYKVGKATE